MLIGKGFKDLVVGFSQHEGQTKHMYIARGIHTRKTRLLSSQDG